MLKQLKKYANWRNILIGFGLCLVFNLVIFPMGLKKIEAVAPDAAGPFDLKFSYSHDQAVAILESYTLEGRSIYAKLEMTVDVLYPIIYGLTFVLLLLLLLPRAFPVNSKIQLLAALPFVITVADFIENTGIVLMLQTYPKEIGKSAALASSFSTIKWSLIGILLIIIITSLIKILINRLQND